MPGLGHADNLDNYFVFDGSAEVIEAVYTNSKSVRAALHVIIIMRDPNDPTG